jgi:small-conductance mechanosensitive channel
MGDIWDFTRETLGIRLFKLGDGDFTLGALLAALIALVTLIAFSRWLRDLISRRLLARGHFDLSTRETVSSLTQYVVLAIGAVTILNEVGIRLSSFTVLAGAFGVGVGFGLQNIFSNFISGLIVMFERPIKIGDHIALPGIDGDVVHIGMRATTLRTAQGSLIMVPNQAIITNSVTNWDQLGNTAVSLQYRMRGAIPDDEALIKRVLRENRGVLKTPEPQVFVPAVDHAGHLMEAHFSIQGDAVRRLAVITEINAAITAELAREGKALASNP